MTISCVAHVCCTSENRFIDPNALCPWLKERMAALTTLHPSLVSGIPLIQAGFDLPCFNLPYSKETYIELPDYLADVDPAPLVFLQRTHMLPFLYIYDPEGFIDWRIPWSWPYSQIQPTPIVILHENTPPKVRAFLREQSISYFTCGYNQLDLKILREMTARITPYETIDLFLNPVQTQSYIAKKQVEKISVLHCTDPFLEQKTNLQINIGNSYQLQSQRLVCPTLMHCYYFLRP